MSEETPPYSEKEKTVSEMQNEIEAIIKEASLNVNFIGFFITANAETKEIDVAQMATIPKHLIKELLEQILKHRPEA